MQMELRKEVANMEDIAEGRCMRGLRDVIPIM
jgi:hypothetical protein